MQYHSSCRLAILICSIFCTYMLHIFGIHQINTIQSPEQQVNLLGSHSQRCRLQNFIIAKHIVPTQKLYSPKSSSCISIRMKYREPRLVRGFINDVLSDAGCSAYLHIKQLSEETFLLLLREINQFKASFHHLYSFQLSLLLLK